MATSLDSQPAVGLSGIPACEPPFDDEQEAAVWATAHQMTLDWPSTGGRGPGHPAVPVRPPAVERPAVAGASAEAKVAVRRFVQLCVEVLNGYRPAAHLRRLSVPAEAAAVVAQGHAAAHRLAEARMSAHPPHRRPHRRPPPVAVVCLRLCEPRPGAVEAAAALLTGDRTWAMALRLERHQDSWAATTLRLI